MAVEVRHREPLAEDSLLGQARIPLSPLLQESWVEGRAGVFAAAPAEGGGAGDGAGTGPEERVQVGPHGAGLPSGSCCPVHRRWRRHALLARRWSSERAKDAAWLHIFLLQVGTLHLVMSLEEVGPALPERPASLAPSPRRAPLQQPTSLAAPAPAVAAPLQLHNCQRLAPAVQQPVAGKQEGPAVPQQGGAKLSAGAVLPSTSSTAPQPQLCEGPELAASLPGEAGVRSAAGLETGLEGAAAPPGTRATAAEAGQASAGETCGPAAPLAAAAPAPQPAPAPAAGGEPASGLQALAPEIEAAWELEVWKRREEERWRAEAKQREAERMVSSAAICRRHLPPFRPFPFATGMAAQHACQ